MHFGVAVCAPLLARWLRLRTFYVLALPPLITFIVLATELPTILAGHAITQQVTWIGTFDLRVSFSIGTLQWVLGLVVSGIGTLVLLYCRWYFASGIPVRTAAILLAFAGAMLGLVTCDDLILLYVFWELTTVFSYLLVGHNPANEANRRAAMTALVVTTVGGLAMLVGILLLGSVAGTFSLQAILSRPPSGAAVSAAVALLLVGALSKSAQLPFHFWLPGAMAAPTPVSAYLHAAAMVKAGVYLVALLAPAFATVPLWRPVLLIIGPLTMLLGGWRALRQHDIKLLLAFGTVSQLGFMITIVGIGTQEAALAGCAVLIGHALFKSALFMIVGIVDHQAGTRDLRALSGVGRQRPALAVVTILAAASMAGIPPTFGFVAKEGALGALLHLGGSAGVAVLVAIVVGSVLTVGYSLRFVWGTFATKKDTDHHIEPTRFPAPALGFWLMPAIPAVLGLLLGFVSGPTGHLLDGYAHTVPQGEPGELVLWHGLTPQLGLSALAIGLGIAIFVDRRRFAALQRTLPGLGDAGALYAKAMRGVDRAAVEITALAQRGSLPVYLGAIALVFVVFPGSALIMAADLPRSVRPFDNPAQVVVGGLIIVAVVLAGRARGRMKAILLVGVTGYGVAFLFLLHGAPDLALTQVLVETVTLIVLALVLRKLGPYFSDRPLASTRWWRLILSLGVGSVAALAGLVAASNRTAEPVSARFAKFAYEFGYGKNVVNVTLVDIRAWDTLGEISVLMVAATGVASLIFLGIRQPVSRPRRRPVEPGEEHTTWLRGQHSLSPYSRSVVFEVMTRLLFPVMILCSLYLLFTGHNAPGGGFAAGLITGLALAVRYLAGGAGELVEAAPVDAGKVLGLGLVVSVLSAVAPMPFGGRILESYAVDLHLGVLGDVHLVTSMFFDIGVYLVVVGVMLDLIRSLGAGVDRQTLEASRS
ncbi:multisubunit sodium/proton antiporter, MrpA subunit /multisubunit sodium/proton antiporter, MrpB subunit [Microlunatus soli]|uniref:Multisubunit sodium/proton antiporter, MrpA subunit /multisubunit sodium/proton antiporter, MrpB subunit n=1 Tax=Microlunatus soli TaxID=630515 RepID=A0A1H1Y9L2_9ACTN|nr:multisubunit sodium/proton antiporter, MrpA subunit /multisubunit sodium/proton antiporter, MrpB subunit [Microlunatus soli]